MFIVAVAGCAAQYFVINSRISIMSSAKNAAHPSGPVSVGAYSVTIDRDLCIGAATCAALAPSTFNLDNEAKAIVLDSAGSDGDEAVLEAAKACPVAAISLKDSSGATVYP